MKVSPRTTLTRKNFLFAMLLLLLVAPAAPAQAEEWEPFVLRPHMTDLRVWTSGERTHARVNITFPDGGYRITNVSPVTRQGNDLSVDFTVEHWTGGTTLALVHREYFFDLGALPAEPGTFTFTVKSRGTNVKSDTFDPRQIVEHWEEASVERNRVPFAVWTAGGVTFTSIGINFPDDGYRVAEWRAPERAGNDFVSRVRLERWTGRASALERKGDKRVFTLGQLPPHETFTVSLEFSDGVRHSSAPFTPAGQARPASMNPAADPAYFVRQHYLDFLGREPDPEGLTFWTGEITDTCVPYSPACVEVKRVNVSAAFFLSIEFQTTGYYVYRLHRAAYGTMPRFAGFLADTRRAGEGLVVGKAGWEALVADNQRRLAEEFTARAEFKERYPETLTPEQYVEALERMIAGGSAGREVGPLTASQREGLAQGLRAGTETRATVLAALAGHEQFARQEFGPAFVLMQYFGYLRRNPDEGRDANLDGYRFWLAKLEQFGGNYISAEMVKAFIDSAEYRERFAPRP